jgi:hypothetical protein
MGARTTVVDELQIGATILRHIAFLVVGDDQQPFVDLAPDERGVLGIPVLLAFGAFRWTADGAFEIDVPTSHRDRREANLCFDGATPVPRGSWATVGSPCTWIPAPSGPSYGRSSPEISRRS